MKILVCVSLGLGVNGSYVIRENWERSVGMRWGTCVGPPSRN